MDNSKSEGGGGRGWVVFGSQEFFSGRLPVQEKCKNFSFDFNPL